MKAEGRKLALLLIYVDDSIITKDDEKGHMSNQSQSLGIVSIEGVEE